MKKLNVGLVGGGFMAKAHSLAYAALPMFFWPAPAIPVRRGVADLNAELASQAKDRLGFEKSYSHWRDLINDPEIDIVDIVTPNHVHAEIAIAAAKAGKHVICEKPLANTVSEAREMLDAVTSAGVCNMVAFNYRRTPAVLLAKKFIDEGRVGEILSFRGEYLQDWSADPSTPLSWRFQKKFAGTGALGDIATHVIDLARFLVGDFKSVNAIAKTWIEKRPIQSGIKDQLGTIRFNDDVPKGLVDVDDAVNFQIKFSNGSIGSIESSRNAHGRNNYIYFEIHGSLGSIVFNYERRDELQVCFANDPVDAKGFRTIYTGPAHPYGQNMWPIPAIGIGYGETKIIECHDFIQAIVNDTTCSPNFSDGYEVSKICESVLESNRINSWIDINSISTYSLSSKD